MGFQHAQLRGTQGENDAEKARQAQELTKQLEKSRGTAASLRSTNADLSTQLDKQTATGLDLKTANGDLTKRLQQVNSELEDLRQSEAKQSELQKQLRSSQQTLNEVTKHQQSSQQIAAKQLREAQVEARRSGAQLDQCKTETAKQLRESATQLEKSRETAAGNSSFTLSLTIHLMGFLNMAFCHRLTLAESCTCYTDSLKRSFACARSACINHCMYASHQRPGGMFQ